jgi:hypothetical protein
MTTGGADGAFNAAAGIFAAGGFATSAYAVYSLMGNGKKIEGCVHQLLNLPHSKCDSFS